MDSSPIWRLHDSFADFRNATSEAGPSYPVNVIAAVAEILKEPYEIELDI